MEPLCAMDKQELERLLQWMDPLKTINIVELFLELLISFIKKLEVDSNRNLLLKFHMLRFIMNLCMIYFLKYQPMNNQGDQLQFKMMQKEKFMLKVYLKIFVKMMNKLLTSYLREKLIEQSVHSNLIKNQADLIVFIQFI